MYASRRRSSTGTPPAACSSTQTPAEGRRRVASSRRSPRRASTKIRSQAARRRRRRGPPGNRRTSSPSPARRARYTTSLAPTGGQIQKASTGTPCAAAQPRMAASSGEVGERIERTGGGRPSLAAASAIGAFVVGMREHRSHGSRSAGSSAGRDRARTRRGTGIAAAHAGEWWRTPMTNGATLPASRETADAGSRSDLLEHRAELEDAAARRAACPPRAASPAESQYERSVRDPSGSSFQHDARRCPGRQRERIAIAQIRGLGPIAPATPPPPRCSTVLGFSTAQPSFDRPAHQIAEGGDEHLGTASSTFIGAPVRARHGRPPDASRGEPRARIRIGSTVSKLKRRWSRAHLRRRGPGGSR